MQADRVRNATRVSRIQPIKQPHITQRMSYWYHHLYSFVVWRIAALIWWLISFLVDNCSFVLNKTNKHGRRYIINGCRRYLNCNSIDLIHTEYFATSPRMSNRMRISRDNSSGTYYKDTWNHLDHALYCFMTLWAWYLLFEYLSQLWFGWHGLLTTVIQPDTAPLRD